MHQGGINVRLPRERALRRTARRGVDVGRHDHRLRHVEHFDIRDVQQHVESAGRGRNRRGEEAHADAVRAQSRIGLVAVFRGGRSLRGSIRDRPEQVQLRLRRDDIGKVARRRARGHAIDA